MHKSELIDVYPGEKEIWGVNSHRQVFYMPLDLSQKGHHAVSMSYFRDIANVQRLLVGEKHKLCVKAVKRPAIYEDKQSGILPLSDICINQLIESLTLQNAAYHWQVADSYFLPKLKAACLIFIAMNIGNYFDSLYIKQFASLPAKLLLDLEVFLRMTDGNKYIVGKLDYETIESELMVQTGKAPFERILGYLLEERKEMAGDLRRKQDFRAVAKMLLKKLDALIKTADKKGDEVAKSELVAYKKAAENFLPRYDSPATTSEPAVTTNNKEEEDDFMIYKEKDKGAGAIRKVSRPEEVVDEPKVLPVPTIKQKEVNPPIVEKEYTLADLIGIKGEEKKKAARKINKTKGGKKSKPITGANKGWSVENDDAPPKESMERIMKQEQEDRELEFILKEIEYQENLQKALELSKQEAELEKIANQGEEHEAHGYYCNYNRAGTRRSGRGFRGGRGRGAVTYRPKMGY